jgi:ATP/maltotriose-dependent transcriptional regulator MalT/DNA-binding SARP family transcriptional activator
MMARPGLVGRILGHDVALLVAPAGFGKSVLVAEVLQGAREPAALYELRAADRDPDRLRAGLGAALGGLPADGPSLLAIDGLEVLQGAVDACEVLNGLLAGAPRGCRLILAGRTLPLLPILSRQRLAGKVLEVGPRDLLLTDEESRTLVGAGEVVDLAGGWPAALRLLHAQPAPWGELFPYIEREVVALLPAEERRILTDLAVTADWSAQTCNWLLQRADGAALLAAWERQLPVGREGRIHPLVRGYFAAQLEREPERCRWLHRRAALLEVERSRPEVALKHALSAADIGLAAPLLRQVGAALVAAGRLDELDGWLARTPDPVLEAAPELLLSSGEALRRSGRPRRGVRHLQTAALGFAVAGDSGGLLRAFCRLALLHADLGEWGEMEAAMAQVATELEGTSGRDRAEALRAQAEYQIGLGQYEAAADGLRQAAQLFVAQGDHEGASAALGGLGAGALVALGRLEEAVQVLRASQGLLGGAAACEALLAEVQILLEQGRWTEAGAVLAVAEPHSPQQQALTLWARARLALGRGDVKTTRLLLAESEALLAAVERTPALQGAALVGDGWLALADGDASRALLCGRQASRLAARGMPLLRYSALGLIAAAEAAMVTAVAVQEQAPAEPTLRVLCLGPFRLLWGEREVAPSHWGRAQVRMLLQCLLLQPDFAAPREFLLETLWPEERPEQSRPRLRVTLNRLRQALQQLGCTLEASTEIIRLPREMIASVDLLEFRQHLAVARSLTGRAPAECLEQCRAGRVLYRGDLLEDAYWPGVESHRQQAQRELAELLQLWQEAAVQVGRTDEAITVLEELLALHPGQEEAARSLMRLLIACGRRGEAAQRYWRMAHWLKAELGLDPSPETQALFREALN